MGQRRRPLSHRCAPSAWLSALWRKANSRLSSEWTSCTASAPSNGRIASGTRLEQLHRQHHFDSIEFPARGALGFRAIQAKRAGLAFADVVLAVRLDGTSQQDREAESRWAGCFEEVQLDFAERFAFEEADVQRIPDESLAAIMQKKGWQLRECVAVRHERIKAATSPPLVTVAIAHHNLGRYFPETLATLAAQTYPNLEVIAIDDGSTDADSAAVFDAMQKRYPAWRFVRQANAGIGMTRNRCLDLARGEFFIPVDADNLPRPDMIATFVAGMQRNPSLSAMTCYFLAFDTDAPNIAPEDFLYAIRPAGGPHALASIRNVYGDANAIFRTSALRKIGGYEPDRGTSCEDWEAFVKLVHAGHRIGVVPDHLFYYRHRPGGFSRSTNWFANHERVLRQFAYAGTLPAAESLTLWTAVLGFHQRLEQLEHASSPRRHRIADRVHSLIHRPLRWMRKRMKRD